MTAYPTEPSSTDLPWAAASNDLREATDADADTPLAWGQWCVLAAAFLSLMFDGVQIGLFPVVVRPALQDLLQISDESVIASWNGKAFKGIAGK